MICKATFALAHNHICIAMDQISARLPRNQCSICNGCVLPASTGTPLASINTNAPGSFSLLQSSQVPNWDKQKEQGCSINKGQLLPGSQCCCPSGSLTSLYSLYPLKRCPESCCLQGKIICLPLTVYVYLFHINTLQCDNFWELLDFGEVLCLFSISAHFRLKNM